MMFENEMLFRVDDGNKTTKPELRDVCHGDPSKTHRVVHVIVMDENSRILAQKRSDSKDIQPGKWDTSVGGHLIPGESYLEAALRETEEELGLLEPELKKLYEYLWISDMESERVTTFLAISNGPFRYDRNEISKVAFFSQVQLKEMAERGELTPNFLHELNMLQVVEKKQDFKFTPFPIQELCSCRKCSRLVAYRRQIKPSRKFASWNYWNRPVPGFGDMFAHTAIVGLAPGAHGANRTGRPFTGDAAGELLFEALHRLGACFLSEAVCRGDGVALKDVYITNIVKCVPPENRPAAKEIHTCRGYLLKELENLPNLRVVMALGRSAFEVLRDIFLVSDEKKKKMFPFKHGAVYNSDSDIYVASLYHPSRRNINTGLLTRKDFLHAMETVFKLAHQACRSS